ncbi:MAG: MarR family transcriptional regulator [Ferrovibrio sp.]
MNDKNSKAGDASYDAATMVALLAAVSDSSQHTQRSLASQLDVALGLANALLRRCVAKGLIKIQDAPARRYAYYLTPKGFTEKSRLVAEYLETSLNFFRHARNQYEEMFTALAAQGVSRAAIAGSGELAEIALLSASAAGITVSAVIAPGRNDDLFHGRTVVANAAAAMAHGAVAVVIADNIAPQVTYDRLAREIPAERLYAPKLLHIAIVRSLDKERAA